jgi:hypothetical protein
MRPIRRSAEADGWTATRSTVAIVIGELLTPEEELFLAETWDSRWMTRPVDECREALRRLIAARTADPGGLRATMDLLDVIDGIVDETHPEGDGCPLCVALDDLRAALAPDATAPETKP